MSDTKGKLYATSAANCGRRSLFAPLIAAAFVLVVKMVSAGPCEDAQRYYQLWMQAQEQAESEVQGPSLAGGIADIGVALHWGPIIADYKAKYEAAAAECEQQGGRQGGTTSRPRVTGPKTQHYGTRGYGPPRTGLDWKPFLADLRPKAVASQIRQGDDYAKQGDWENAKKYYDLAKKIDPKNQRARQKADEAQQKLKQAEQESQPPPAPASQPPTTSPQPAPENQTTIPPPTISDWDAFRQQVHAFSEGYDKALDESIRDLQATGEFKAAHDLALAEYAKVPSQDNVERVKNAIFAEHDAKDLNELEQALTGRPLWQNRKQPVTDQDFKDLNELEEALTGRTLTGKQ